jgi:cell division protein ZapA
MPEVNVEINGRKYRIACEEGQEEHLLSLAERFNRTVDKFKDGFGEVGDNRLTVMAGIAVMDDLAEAERRIALLKEDIAALTQAGQALTAESEELERRFARRLNEVARKVEAVATAIDETGAATERG